MPPIASCFSGSGSSNSPASGPTISTSIYETHLGTASLTWSRTFLGLSLVGSLRLHSRRSIIRFRIRPWLFWNRKGVLRFSPQISVSWNLSRARFHYAGSPEPSSGFSLSLSVDRETALLAGDMADPRPKAPLVSRKEQAVMAAGEYRTAVRIRGRVREIRIRIDGGMSVSLDGNPLLHLRRVRWKFRGSHRTQIDDDGGCSKILISWDLLAWLFPPKEDSPAIFVFCFEEQEEGIAGGKGREMTLFKTSSSSSAASSTVMDWSSSEEAEMHGIDGFTLVVYAWKKKR